VREHSLRQVRHGVSHACQVGLSCLLDSARPRIDFAPYFLFKGEAERGVRK
jgi:hypothetical protein